MAGSRITVFGAGAWGTAVAAALAARHQVVMWCRDPVAAQQIAASGRNERYLPGVALPASLQVTSDLAAACAHAQDLAVLGTPLAGLAVTCDKLRELGLAAQGAVWLCKGIDPVTLQRPAQIVQQRLSMPSGALSGPSFADEVARGLPAALVLASDQHDWIGQAQTMLHGGPLRVYGNDDLIGVEIGGAVKNVIAIAAGISDGLDLGLNARAALITRGLAEISRLGVALGARADTFAGLSGLGDLVLTCTGDRSRNRRVGLALARGEKLAEILAKLGHVSEGVACADAIRRLATEHQVDMPIAQGVAAVLFDDVEPRVALGQLMSRQARWEREIGTGVV